MSIVKSASKVQTHDDDAPRATRAARSEVVAPEPLAPEAEVLDVAREDPYDNIACTD
jgi:hypothetical protein